MTRMKLPHTSSGEGAEKAIDLLARVDLNLLVALHALLVECSVTKAARRLGTTQSALSHTLRRLREQFADSLLVNTTTGMVPTALAASLLEPLQQALLGVVRTLQVQPDFDPQTSDRSFVLACADYGSVVLLPKLMARLQQQAPRICVNVRPAHEGSGAELVAGKLDLLLGALPPEAPEVVGRRLFEETFVCLVRREHPLVGTSLTLQQYVALPHLLISPMGTGVTWVDPVLEQLGYKRNIAMRVPHYLVAPQVVASTDLILTVAARVARLFAQSLPLREVTPPIAIPGFSVSAFWHPRSSQDPGHRWFREQLFAVGHSVSSLEPSASVTIP